MCSIYHTTNAYTYHTMAHELCRLSYHLWGGLENSRWIFTPWKFNIVPTPLCLSKRKIVIFQALNFQGKLITLSISDLKGFPLSCYSQLRSSRWQAVPNDFVGSHTFFCEFPKLDKVDCTQAGQFPIPEMARSIPWYWGCVPLVIFLAFTMTSFFQMKAKMNMSFMSHDFPRPWLSNGKPHETTIPKWNPY